MSDHRIVDSETWLAERGRFLEREKEFTRERDALSQARRELPWLEITDDYTFDDLDGQQRSLVDLFEGRGQLLVWHFMLGPDWEEGCPSCSFWADNYNGTLEHLAARDTSLVAVSRSSVERITAYRDRMGWSFPWVSSLSTPFNFDFGVSFTPEQVESGEPLYNLGTLPAFAEELPGLSVFRRTDAGLFLTYQTFARGLDILNGVYNQLDLTPKGRDEGGNAMSWLRRRDSY